MNVDSLQQLLVESLKERNVIETAVVTEGSMLISCSGRKEFYISIRETCEESPEEEMRMDEKVRSYTKTHDLKAFLNDLSELASTNPGFYCTFLFVNKFEEMGFIDKYCGQHILKSAIGHTKEMDQFVRKLLLFFH